MCVQFMSAPFAKELTGSSPQNVSRSTLHLAVLGGNPKIVAEVLKLAPELVTHVVGVACMSNDV
jgi:hypothetical protein